MGAEASASPTNGILVRVSCTFNHTESMETARVRVRQDRKNPASPAIQIPGVRRDSALVPALYEGQAT